MKKKFGLACATLVAMSLMACSEDSTNTITNTESLLASSASVGEELGGDPALNPDVNPDVPGEEVPGNENVDPGIPGEEVVPGGEVVPGEPGEEVNPGIPGEEPNPTSSNSDPTPASSDSEPVIESSSEVALGPTEKTYAFGYALKNAARPSKGCGKNSTLVKTKSVENGDRFEMNINGENREYFITLPSNYDNKKPYKLLFAMHCMGSNAEDFVHHFADQDHPSPYYGQQKLDTEGNYIFVAPRGDTDGMPWSMTSDKDHKFFDKLLTTVEDNYCIDTSRVFATGFSFGAMYTNSLAWDMQHRLRAVAVYAPVAEVIYLPKNAGKPIAWMAVHGKRDSTCQYSHDLQSTLPAILKNNGKASDGDSQFTDASSEKPEEFNGTAGHLCYDFKTVDPRFPVKFCSWNGEHQWTAHDGGNTGVGQGWENTWVPEEVHKFFEQF